MKLLPTIIHIAARSTLIWWAWHLTHGGTFLLNFFIALIWIEASAWIAVAAITVWAIFNVDLKTVVAFRKQAAEQEHVPPRVQIFMQGVLFGVLVDAGWVATIIAVMLCSGARMASFVIVKSVAAVRLPNEK